jgi:hypothetical protein
MSTKTRTRATITGTTATDHYDTFLECNSLGVANLTNGNLPHAYRQLCKAFDIAKHAQTVAEQAESSSSAFRADDETSNIAPLQPPAADGTHQQVAWPLLSREEVIPTLSLTKSFDLRTDGLMISADALARNQCDGGSIGRDEWTLASAFVVYNLGILYSIGATQGSNEAHHEKARMMFESSIGLIRCAFRRERQALNRESKVAIRRLCPTGNPLVDVLSLMVLAKTSQAYHFLSRFDGACAYAAQLSDFTSLLRQDLQYSGDEVVNELVETHCERLAYELSSLLKLQALAPAA